MRHILQFAIGLLLLGTGLVVYFLALDTSVKHDVSGESIAESRNEDSIAHTSKPPTDTARRDSASEALRTSETPAPVMPVVKNVHPRMPEAAWAGVVVDGQDLTPLARVAVTLTTRGGLESAQTMHCDDLGVFQFRDPSRGFAKARPLTLTHWWIDFVVPGYRELRVKDPERKLDGWVVKLERAPSVELLVLDSVTGKPIEDYFASFLPPKYPSYVLGERKPARHIHGLSKSSCATTERARVFVDAPGYPILETHAEIVVDYARVEIPPGGTVLVNSVREGRPAPGVKLSLRWSTPHAPYAVTNGTWKYPNAAATPVEECKVLTTGVDMGEMTRKFRIPTSHASLTTDVNGRAQFDRVPPGEFLVTAELGPWIAKSKVFPMAAGETVNVKIALESYGSIAGVLRGVKSPGGYRVDLHSADEPRWMSLPISHAMPSSNGSFSFTRVVPGQYYVHVKLTDGKVPGGVESLTERAAVESDRQTPVELDAERKPDGIVRGRLTIQGHKSDALQVQVNHKEFRRQPSAFRQRLGPDGLFQFEGVGAGNILLELFSEAGQGPIVVLGPQFLTAGTVVDFTQTFHLGTASVKLPILEGGAIQGVMEASLDGSAPVHGKPGEVVHFIAPEGPVKFIVSWGDRQWEGLGTVHQGDASAVELVEVKPDR